MNSGRAAPNRPLTRNRDFTLLWLGQAASGLGSSASFLAYPLLVLATTGSAVAAGAVGTLTGAIRTIFRIPGGALADRWNRRAMMMACDAGRIILLATLGVVVITDRTHLVLIIVVAVASTLFDVVFEPASLAAVSQVVPADQLPQAFGWNEARSFAASTAGPPLGAMPRS